MRHTFISQWNDKSFFLDMYLTVAPDMKLFTDASGALGYAAYFQGHRSVFLCSLHMVTCDKIKDIP